MCLFNSVAGGCGGGGRAFAHQVAHPGVEDVPEFEGDGHYRSGPQRIGESMQNWPCIREEDADPQQDRTRMHGDQAEPASAQFGRGIRLEDAAEQQGDHGEAELEHPPVDQGLRRVGFDARAGESGTFRMIAGAAISGMNSQM